MNHEKQRDDAVSCYPWNLESLCVPACLTISQG